MCGKQQFKYSNTQKPGKPPELELDMEFFQKSKEYPGEYLCKRCYANNTEALFKIA